jgi:hypothetical protein
MGMAIMIVMIATAGLTMIIFKASPEATLREHHEERDRRDDIDPWCFVAGIFVL